jgi:hypothetical protein
MKYLSYKSRDSSVDIVTGYGQDSWISNPGRVTIFLFFTASKTSHPTRARHFLPGVKLPGRYHSLPSTAYVKNGEAIPLFPIYLHSKMLN